MDLYAYFTHEELVVAVAIISVSWFATEPLKRLFRHVTHLGDATPVFLYAAIAITLTMEFWPTDGLVDVRLVALFNGFVGPAIYKGFTTVVGQRFPNVSGKQPEREPEDAITTIRNVYARHKGGMG